MIKNITGAFERPFHKNDNRQQPHSSRKGIGTANGLLPLRELRLLVAGMVD